MTASPLGLAVAVFLVVAPRIYLTMASPQWLPGDHLQHYFISRTSAGRFITGKVIRDYWMDHVLGTPVDYPPVATTLLSAVGRDLNRRRAVQFGGVVADLCSVAILAAAAGDLATAALVIAQPGFLAEGRSYGSRPVGTLCLALFLLSTTLRAPLGALALALVASLLALLTHKFTAQATVVTAVGFLVAGDWRPASGLALGLVVLVAVSPAQYRRIVVGQVRNWAWLRPRLRHGVDVPGIPLGAPSRRQGAGVEAKRVLSLAPVGILMMVSLPHGEALGAWFALVGFALLVGTTYILRPLGEAWRYLKVASLLLAFSHPTEPVVGLYTLAVAAGVLRYVVLKGRADRLQIDRYRGLIRLGQSAGVRNQVAATYPVEACLPLLYVWPGPVYVSLSVAGVAYSEELRSLSSPEYFRVLRGQGVDVVFTDMTLTEIGSGWRLTDRSDGWCRWDVDRAGCGTPPHGSG